MPMNPIKRYRFTLCTVLTICLMPPLAGAAKFMPSESLTLAEDFPLPALTAAAGKAHKVTLHNPSTTKSKSSRKKQGLKRVKGSKRSKKTKNKTKKSSAHPTLDLKLPL
jgi:hypothetical protein